MIVPKLRFKGFDQDWTGLKIKDLVKSLDAGVSVNSEDVEPKEDEYSVLKTSCISSGYFDENERKRVLQDGEIQRLKEPVLDDSILMSRMNTPLLVGMNAYVFKAPKNTFLPDRLWQLKIDDNKTVTRWLAFYLGSDQGLNQIRDLASGTSNSMKNITKPDVLNIDLFAPQKEEQTKIASFLSAVDEKISQLTRKHELLSQYKQGMMQKLFTQQIRFKADDGSEFGEWVNKKIIEVADYVDFRGKTPKKVNNGILLVTAKNIRFGYIDYEVSREYIGSDDFKEVMRRGCAKIGDVLITTEAPLGNVASVDREDIALAQRVIKYRGKEGILNNAFLKQKFLSEDFQALIASKATGGTVQGIKGSTLHNLEIYIPQDIEEQTKIANFLSAIDQKIEVVAQQIEQAKQWKKGLLQQMFV